MLPCENAQKLLSTIRKELAKRLVFEHGLKQREVAKILNISEAAVSQYLHEKRGKLELTEKAARELEKLAIELAKGKKQGFCRICNLLRGELN